MSYQQASRSRPKIASPVIVLTRRCTFATWIGVCHRGSHFIHSVREVGRERRLHLGKVQFSLLALQGNSLCKPGSSIRESFKAPLKRQGSTVQTHLNRRCAGRSDLCNKPTQRLLPRQPRGAARPRSERSVQLKLCWRVVPVPNIGPEVPSEGRACGSLDRMSYFPNRRRHGSPPQVTFARRAGPSGGRTPHG